MPLGAEPLVIPRNGCRCFKTPNGKVCARLWKRRAFVLRRYAMGERQTTGGCGARSWAEDRPRGGGSGEWGPPGSALLRGFCCDTGLPLTNWIGF